MLELNSGLQCDPETLNLADCSVLLGFVPVDLFEFVDGGLPCAEEDLWMCRCSRSSTVYKLDNSKCGTLDLHDMPTQCRCHGLRIVARHS